MVPGGQVSKRLQIIKIAISITDEETINLQRLKLRVYKNDKQLETILAVLEDENHAQASSLIDRYLHGPFQEKEPYIPTPAPSKRDTEEEELIKKFGLFMDAKREERHNPIEIKEMIQIEDDFDNILIPQKTDQGHTISKKVSTEEIIADFNSIKEEIVRDTHPTPPPQAHDKQAEQDKETEENREAEEISGQTIDDILAVSPKQKQTAFSQENDKIQPPPLPKQEKQHHAKDSTAAYSPISYVDHKFKNMLNQYPQILESTERFEREEKLLYKISLEGYDEVDIDDIITDIQLLKEAGKLAEAAHLLLIIAFTESLYAQLIFARELYKGEILQKDVPEAFTQINRLAIENYPEAICDLAQFYEKGIGINKDKKKAFRLYEDALELGVLRAERHIVRMQEESKGFFGKLFN